jgi:hypothetical protein
MAVNYGCHGDSEADIWLPGIYLPLRHIAKLLETIDIALFRHKSS